MIKFISLKLALANRTKHVA